MKIPISFCAQKIRSTPCLAISRIPVCTADLPRSRSYVADLPHLRRATEFLWYVKSPKSPPPTSNGIYRPSEEFFRTSTEIINIGTSTPQIRTRQICRIKVDLLNSYVQNSVARGPGYTMMTLFLPLPELLSMTFITTSDCTEGVVARE